MTDDDSRSPYKSQNDYLGKDFLDVEWEFIQADEKNPAVQEYIREMAEEEHTRLTIAVCVPDSDQAIAIGVNLPPAVYESAVQVLIYQQKGDAIVRKLSGSAIAGHSYYAKVHPFGMSSDGYDLDLVHKLVFIAANANKEGERSLQHMLSVDVAKQLQKASESKSAAANMWSNIYHASHMWTKLRSVGSKDGSLSEEDVAILGQTEHIRWNVEQLLTQYRPLTEAEQVLETEYLRRGIPEIPESLILDVDLDNFLCARALHPRDASYFLELAERAELITVSLERDWVRCLRFRGETVTADSLFEELLLLGK